MTYDAKRAVEESVREADGREASSYEQSVKRVVSLSSYTAALIGRALREGAKRDCNYCVRVNIGGGPDHDAMPHCRSGRHPHCTCDGCF